MRMRCDLLLPRGDVPYGSLRTVLLGVWMLVACESNPPVIDPSVGDGSDTGVGIDTAVDTDIVNETSLDVTCEAPSSMACCCYWDQVSQPMCAASGWTCRSGYNLYFGPDCDWTIVNGPCSIRTDVPQVDRGVADAPDEAMPVLDAATADSME